MRAFLVALAILAAICPAVLQAQTNADVNAGVQFDVVAGHGHLGVPTNVGVNTMTGLADTESNSISGAVN